MNAANFETCANELTVELVFSNIQVSMRRTTESVLAVGKYLVDFEGYKEYAELKKKLISEKLMAESTISQYVQIGKCTVLSQVVDKLPASFNSIYHLAKLEKKAKGLIERKIAEDKLNPSTTLEEIRLWGEARQNESQWVSITIEVPAGVSNEIRELIREAAIRIAKENGVDIKPPAGQKAAAKKKETE